MYWRYLSNIHVSRQNARIWCNFWRTICQNRRRNAYQNNFDPIHHGNINPLPDTVISVRSWQGLLLLFLDKRDDFANKNEKCYNPSIKKILITINEMPHQPFYKEPSNVTWEDFLAIKFGFWIDTHASTNNSLHGSGSAVGKSGKVKKHPRTVMVILHATCLVLKMQWSTWVSLIPAKF